MSVRSSSTAATLDCGRARASYESIKDILSKRASGDKSMFYSPIRERKR